MIKSMLGRLRGNVADFAPICPGAPFYAIGDIHGRIDLLTSLLRRLDPDLPVVFVGDYVDRGENSAEVLRLLQDRPATRCLKGNHEAMMLGFLDQPETRGSQWLRNGGLQTLASFGITGLTETTSGAALKPARDALRDAMGQAQVDWLRGLPLYWQTGNVAIVHAGADPMVDIVDQPADFLLWGHPEFGKTRRGDGVWVVHGHTVVDTPSARDGRIAIDTGAFATGRLTAARIAADNVQFIST